MIDLRHLRHHAGQHGQAAGVVGGGLVVLLRSAFDAFFEHEVHSQADAEERHAGGDALTDDAGLPERLHRGGRVGERAHAGQHNGVGMGDGGRVVGDEHVAARRRQAALDALQVPFMIVDDGNHSRVFQSHVPNKISEGFRGARSVGPSRWPAGRWNL